MADASIRAEAEVRLWGETVGALVEIEPWDRNPEFVSESYEAARASEVPLPR